MEKDRSKWTVEDVCSLLSEEGFDEEVLRLFQVNKINGRVLHTLSDTDLKDLGVEAMGDRRYLLQLFKKRSDVVHIADDTPQETDTNDQVSNDTNNEEQEQSHTGEVPESANDGEFELEPESVKNHEPGPSNDTETNTVLVLEHHDVDIPDPFPFPVTYGVAVDVALMTGKMCPSTTTKFFSRIAGVMAIYKTYPNRVDYDRIARAIIQKFPFLKNPINGHLSIIKKLQDRFTEMRRYSNKKENKPVVRKLSDKLIPAGKKRKDKQLPENKYEIPVGEDKASFDYKNSSLKKKPSRPVMEDLMESTFAMRRIKIETEVMPLNQLLAEFPYLKDPQQIITELGRLTSKSFEGYHDLWLQQWMPKIVAGIKGSITTTNEKRMCIDVKSDLDDADAGNLTIKALYSLVYVLKDHKTKPNSKKLMTIVPITVKLDDIAIEIEEAAPTLIVAGTLNEVKEVGVAAERAMLMKCKPVEAPLYLLAAYYAYNIKYPEGLENFYMLLEYIVLEKSPPKKMPANLAHFITYIHSL